MYYYRLTFVKDASHAWIKSKKALRSASMATDFLKEEHWLDLKVKTVQPISFFQYYFHRR